MPTPVREKKIVFTFPIVAMFTMFLWATVTSPPPRDDERWLLFALGVSTCLIPAFLFIGLVELADRKI